jgi:hypothetical protein
MEVHIDEIIPVVVDPSSEYYGRVGKMRASDREFGDCYFRFDNDDDAVILNDGWTTGVPQFIGFLKTEQDEADLLVESLPGLRDKFVELFSQVVRPNVYPPTPETAAARVGFTALINSVTKTDVSA